MEKKFIVDQKSLLSLLSSMQPICTKRTTLDATTAIHFSVSHRELVLKSTDLEISLQASCSLNDSTLTSTESFMVSGRRIFDIVKELDGTIQCSFDNNQLSFTAGGVHLALNIKDAQGFPPFPERIENLMHLDAALMREMLESVVFLIPQSNPNPALNGLFLEISDKELRMTTTDGHCLAQVRTEHYKIEQPRSWLLPRRAVFELKKILESSQDTTIFLGICGNQLVFSGQLFNFFTKLLGDQFPQYRAILDKSSFIGATIDRSPLMKTLRRSACLLSGQFLATRFGFSRDIVRVSMHNKEVGKLDEELAISGFDAEQLDIRFYAPYVLSGLQAFNGEKITFFLNNSTKPIIFESHNERMHMTYLVMPVAQTSQ